MSVRVGFVAVVSVLMACSNGSTGRDAGAPDSGSPDAGRVADCTPTGTHETKNVWNHVTLPTTAGDARGEDLDGDGRPDNQLASIFAAFATQGTDLQASEDSAIASGQALMLFDETSVDEMFVADSCAQTTARLAQVQMNPDFSGDGTFTAASNATQLVVSGTAVAGMFDSPAVATSLDPHPMTLQLAIGPTLVRLTSIGTHLRYARTDAGTISGSLAGAFTRDDVNNNLVPALANLVNHAMALADGGFGPTSLQLSLFDLGCASSCPTCDAGHDGRIEPCELSGNNEISTLFQPDVQLFQGTDFHPTTPKTQADSLSFGIGFTAVGAR